MVSLHIEDFLADVCSRSTPAAAFEALMPVLGERLECDRIFLYLRSPHRRMGRVPFCWQRHEGIPRVYDPDWKPEPDTLVQEDPMFAAAVRAEPSVFVDDVEAASPSVVNRDFEAKTFGHRALIHAHLSQEGKTWGILQPAVFGRPRVWTQAERTLIETTVARITPLAVDYVTNSLPSSHGKTSSHDR